MERHAALPDREDPCRIRKIVARLIEEDLPEAAAEDDAEHAVKEQVVELLHRPAVLQQLRMRLDAVLAQPPELEERQKIHQAVPVDGERPDGDCDGVELGMNKHDVLA